MFQVQPLKLSHAKPCSATSSFGFENGWLHSSDFPLPPLRHPILCAFPMQMWQPGGLLRKTWIVLPSCQRYIPSPCPRQQSDPKSPSTSPHPISAGAQRPHKKWQQARWWLYFVPLVKWQKFAMGLYMSWHPGCQLCWSNKSRSWESRGGWWEGKVQSLPGSVKSVHHCPSGDRNIGDLGQSGPQIPERSWQANHRSYWGKKIYLLPLPNPQHGSPKGQCGLNQRFSSWCLQRKTRRDLWPIITVLKVLNFCFD